MWKDSDCVILGARYPNDAIFLARLLQGKMFYFSFFNLTLIFQGFTFLKITSLFERIVVLSRLT